MEQYKGKITASLVLGIISVALIAIFSWNIFYLDLAALVCGIVGLVLGIQIRKAYQANNEKPTGMATAGFVLSIIGTILSAVLFISCVAVIACAGCAIANAGIATQDILNGLY